MTGVTIQASGDVGEEHRMDIVSDIVSDTHVLVRHGDFDVRSTWEVRNAIYECIDVHDDDTRLALRIACRAL